jgi:hypothetical protein
MNTTWLKANYDRREFHPEYKYTWTSQAQVVTDFGNFGTFWGSKSLHDKKGIRHGITVKMLGEPQQRDFARRNILKFDLKPYQSINLSGVQTFGTHQLMVPAFRRVFEKWAKWGGYPLCGIGSSYDPRYAYTDAKLPAYQARVANAKPNPYVWLQENLPQLKQIPGLENKRDKDWEWLPTLLFFYDNAHDGVDPTKLSNHSYGAALDVNPGTNALSSKLWDMPPKLVEIFREEGFYWGGYYSLAELDAMHFEYMLNQPPRALPVFIGPFAHDLPLKLYDTIESGESGYYPFSINSNLHGGVHVLPKGTGATPSPPVSSPNLVRASMPGYIIAARLLAKDTFASDNLPYAACNGHLGLVVVRHSGHELDGAGAPVGDPIAWYAVYLHLAPPAYDLGAQDDWNSVPWYRRLLLAKYGAAVVLDPQSTAFEQNVWLSNTVAANATDASGYPFGLQSGSEKPTPIPLKIKANDGTTRLLVTKPAPQDLTEAIDSLAKGNLITFHQPFLKIEADEPIGAVGPVALAADPTGMVQFFADNAKTLPSLLHWEWLSPTGPKGLRSLTALAGFPDTTMPAVTESTGRADNYFDKDELQQLFSGLIPENERNDFNTVLKTENYGFRLQTFLTKKTSFSSSTRNDLQPTATGPCPKTYALELNFKNEHGLQAPAAGKSYSVDFEFFQRVPSGEKSISKKSWTLTDVSFAQPLVIQAPIEAEFLRITSADFHIDEIRLDNAGEMSDAWSFYTSITQQRLRGVILDHINDWTVAGIRDLTAKLKEKGVLPKEIPADGLTPIAWYNRTHDDADPLSENPILGPAESEVSLFTGAASPSDNPGSEYLLPATTSIINMHPVSGLWLVKLLEKQRTLHIVEEFTLWQPAEVADALWWSIVRAAPTTLYGERLHLIAIAKGFPNTGTVIFKLDHGARTLQYETPYLAGLARQPVLLMVWGAWRLSLAGASSEPAIDGFTLSLDAPSPTLLGPLRWTRDKKSGGITLQAFFKQRCPEILRTFLHMTTHAADTVHSSGYANLIQCRKRKGYDDALDDAGIRFDCAKGKKVSPYFTLDEIKKAAKVGACQAKPHLALIWILDTLKEAWKVERPADSSVPLYSLGADGLSGTVRFKKNEAAASFATLAQNLFKSDITVTPNNTQVTIALADPGPECGEVTTTFNPADGFGKLLQNVQSSEAAAEQRIGFELVCPNGTDFSTLSIDEDDWDHKAVDFNQAKMTQIYGEEIVTTPGFAFQKLKPASFGEVRLRLKTIKKRGSESTLIEILQLLNGSINDWRKAKPKIAWNFSGNTQEWSPAPTAGMVVGAVAFDESMVGEQATIKATVMNNPAVFDGISLEMPGRESGVLINPKFGLPQATQDKTKICVSIFANLIPIDRLCSVKVQKTGATDEENAALTDLLKFTTPGKSHLAKQNADGCYGVVLRKRGLNKGDVLTFTFALVAEDGVTIDNVDVLGTIIDQMNYELIIG